MGSNLSPEQRLLTAQLRQMLEDAGIIRQFEKDGEGMFEILSNDVDKIAAVFERWEMQKQFKAN